MAGRWAWQERRRETQPGATVAGGCQERLVRDGCWDVAGWPPRARTALERRSRSCAPFLVGPWLLTAAVRLGAGGADLRARAAMVSGR